MAENDNTWISYNLSRGPIRGDNKHRIGLTLKVQAHEQLEAYMRTLSNDRAVEATAYAEGWHNVGSAEPLQVYVLDDNNMAEGLSGYTLQAVGGPLMNISQQAGRAGRAIGEDAPFIDHNANGKLNLSFLRIVGISNPDGVTLGFAGAYSADYVMKVRQKLSKMTERFLHDYLVPMDINLQLVSRQPV